MDEAERVDKAVDDVANLISSLESRLALQREAGEDEAAASTEAELERCRDRAALLLRRFDELRGRDALEAKLCYAGSAAARKYPRCSVRGKATYSDCVVDEGQMWALWTSYLGVFAIGVSLAVFDFGGALDPSEGARAPDRINHDACSNRRTHTDTRCQVQTVRSVIISLWGRR